MDHTRLSGKFPFSPFSHVFLIFRHHSNIIPTSFQHHSLISPHHSHIAHSFSHSRIIPTSFSHHFRIIFASFSLHSHIFSRIIPASFPLFFSPCLVFSSLLLLCNNLVTMLQRL